MNNPIIQRMLSGWTLIRGLYLVIGLFVIGQAIVESQFILLLLGGYFSSMGLFNYGCAAGACATGFNTPGPPQKQAVEVKDVEYEEIGKRS